MSDEAASAALPKLRELAPDPTRPPKVEVRDQGARLSVLDRGTRLTYELVRERPPATSARGARGQGAGWLEAVRLAGERQTRVRAVSATEPFAYMEEFGAAEHVFEATKRMIRELAAAAREIDERIALLREGGAPAAERTRERKRAEALRRQARRLLRELGDGVDRERIGVRRLQALVLARVEAGHSLSELCRAGGFGDTKPDTGWFQRRVGLEMTACSVTGKRYFARTIEHEIAARVARALGIEPVEVGL